MQGPFEIRRIFWMMVRNMFHERLVFVIQNRANKNFMSLRNYDKKLGMIILSDVKLYSFRNKGHSVRSSITSDAYIDCLWLKFLQENLMNLYNYDKTLTRTILFVLKLHTFENRRIYSHSFFPGGRISCVCDWNLYHQNLYEIIKVH